MNLAIVFIIVICMMGLFAAIGVIMMKKSNEPATKPTRIYKSGEEAPPK